MQVLIMCADCIRGVVLYPEYKEYLKDYDFLTMAEFKAKLIQGFSGDEVIYTKLEYDDLNYLHNNYGITIHL